MIYILDTIDTRAARTIDIDGGISDSVDIIDVIQRSPGVVETGFTAKIPIVRHTGRADDPSVDIDARQQIPQPPGAFEFGHPGIADKDGCEQCALIIAGGSHNGAVKGGIQLQSAVIAAILAIGKQVAQIAVIERRINLVGNEITHISREGIRLHGFHDKEFTVGAHPVKRPVGAAAFNQEFASGLRRNVDTGDTLVRRLFGTLPVGKHIFHDKRARRHGIRRTGDIRRQVFFEESPGFIDRKSGCTLRGGTGRSLVRFPYASEQSGSNDTH